MRLSCPACEALYDVPDSLIGEGRLLRCARCEQEWLVTPPAPPPGMPSPMPPLPPLPPEPAALPQAPAPAPAMAAPVAGEGRLWLAWGASVAVVVLALVALWLVREPLAEAWPPLLRLLG